MPVFDTPEPIRASVDLPIGELRIVASPRTDTQVDVRSEPRDRAHAEAIRVELVAGELRVTGAPLGLLQKLTPSTPGRSIEVEIGLPTDSSLTAHTGYGGVTTEGRLGACEVHARFGDVRVDEAVSALLAVGYGQARVTGSIDGDADLTADHGGVRVARVGGAAVLRSKHGAIRADTLAGKAELVGTHGDIDVDEAEADVRARTAYGSVRLNRVHRGEVAMTSTHGRLEVGVARTSAAWLDVDTDGRVSNALSPRDDPAGFTATVSINARSRLGDIAIHRA